MSFAPNDFFNSVKSTLQDSKINQDLFLAKCRYIISLIYNKYDWPFFNALGSFSNSTADVNYVAIDSTIYADMKKINALFFDYVKPEYRKRKINHNLLFSIENSGNILHYNDLIRSGYIYFDANLSGTETIYIFYKQKLDINSLTLIDDIPLPDDFLQVIEDGVSWQLSPYNHEPQSQNGAWYNLRDAFRETLTQKIKDYSVVDDYMPIINTSNIQNELNDVLGGFFNESEI